MIRSTPLKIFDENAGSTQVKQGKGGGVPIKKGLQQSAAKSTRKALSSLSTSQINIRQTPASVVVPMKGKQVAMVKPVTKPKILDEFYVDDFKPVKFLSICSFHFIV